MGTIPNEAKPWLSNHEWSNYDQEANYLLGTSQMRFWVILGACTVLAGCGSITRGTNEDVAINVTPSNADVRLSNGMQCQGSCVVKIPRKDTFSVTASAPGYAPQTVAVGRKIKGGGTAGLAGNIVAGGIVGIGVDAATGAAYDHEPNPVVINLERGSSTPATRPPASSGNRRGTPTS